MSSWLRMRSWSSSLWIVLKHKGVRAKEAFHVMDIVCHTIFSHALLLWLCFPNPATKIYHFTTFRAYQLHIICIVHRTQPQPSALITLADIYSVFQIWCSCFWAQGHTEELKDVIKGDRGRERDRQTETTRNRDRTVTATLNHVSISRHNSFATQLKNNMTTH